MAPERDIDLEKYSTSSTSLPSYRPSASNSTSTSTSTSSQEPRHNPITQCTQCGAWSFDVPTFAFGGLCAIACVGLLAVQAFLAQGNAGQYCRDRPWMVGIYNNMPTAFFGIFFMVAVTLPAHFCKSTFGLRATIFGSMLLWTVFAVFLAPFTQKNPLVCEGQAILLYANGTTCFRGVCEAYVPLSRWIIWGNGTASYQ